MEDTCLFCFCDENLVDSCSTCKAKSHVKCWNTYLIHEIPNEEHVFVDENIETEMRTWTYAEPCFVKCPNCRIYTNVNIGGSKTRSQTKHTRQTCFIIQCIIEHRKLYNDTDVSFRKFLDFVYKNKLIFKDPEMNGMYFLIEKRIYEIWLLKGYDFIPRYYELIYNCDINKRNE